VFVEGSEIRTPVTKTCKMGVEEEQEREALLS
jgi:hypothetical protein